MAFETDEDLLAMLDGHETAVYSAATIKGIFDHAYIDPLDIMSEAPAFTCRSSDVSGVAKNDAITVGGVSYKVKTPQPDGTGLITLILEKQ